MKLKINDSLIALIFFFFCFILSLYFESNVRFSTLSSTCNAIFLSLWIILTAHRTNMKQRKWKNLFSHFRWMKMKFAKRTTEKLCYCLSYYLVSTIYLHITCSCIHKMSSIYKIFSNNSFKNYHRCVSCYNVN